MKGKIAQYPISLALAIIGSVIAFSLLFLFVSGFVVGIVVEMFRGRKVAHRKLKPTEHKIPEIIVEEKVNGKPEKKGKIFKLPLPEPIQNERMVYAREK